MKRTTTILAAFLLAFAIGTVDVSAQNTIPGTNTDNGTIPGTNTNCKDNPTAAGCPENKDTVKPGGALQVRLNNPLKVKTVQEAVQLFMNAVIKIAIPFIVVFFIWSGFNFILAQGNKEKVTKAKNMFFNTVIGTLLILGAWAITNAIIGTINSVAN